ncbi:MAG: acyltransferase [Beijerinckiaceae bacterium]|jgi:peptidoglycan/LPS O-acetylase OafA/YrhL|nr:acyltransferase [Beijerinckiaceae bacterium]
MATSPASQTIAVLQVLRAVAALTVVFGHAQHDALISAMRAGQEFARNHALPWGAGVDLFFVISGFIMVHASERLFGREGAAKEFALRRLIRIVPLYWLLATAYLILASQFGREANRPDFSAGELIASYVFWPLDLFRDGHPRPFYTLGWTLNYEMFFYALFASALFLPREKAVLAVTAALLALVSLGALVPGLPTPISFWSKPIVLEFVAGMGIALAHRRGIRLPRPTQLAMLVTAFVILFADPMGASVKPENWITPNDGVRLFCWGLPAALLMAAFMLSPAADQRAEGPLARFWVHLGDASYALYLIHPFVIVSLRKVWVATGAHQAFGFWPMVALTLVLSIAAALLAYRLIEKPVTRALNAALLQPSLPSAGNASSR